MPLISALARTMGQRFDDKSWRGSGYTFWTTRSVSLFCGVDKLHFILAIARSWFASAEHAERAPRFICSWVECETIPKFPIPRLYPELCEIAEETYL
jgi:hypothetical protein